jgi:hypothetical protein
MTEPTDAVDVALRVAGALDCTADSMIPNSTAAVPSSLGTATRSS